MDVLRYLQRIGLPSETANHALDGELLEQLQRAHLCTVPFENLSIHSSEIIHLESDWLFDKIINRRRGGFCYELNGLFSELLTRLGYQVQLLSARVASSETGDFGLPFDHLTLRVDLDQPWLVDVGFGRNFQAPLRLDLRSDQVQPEGTYRFSDHEDEIVYNSLGDDSAWNAQYIFDLEPCQITDFAAMCRHHQFAPESSFRRSWTCSRTTEQGRLTLSAKALIETRGSERVELEHTSARQVYALLDEHFGIRHVDLIGIPREIA